MANRKKIILIGKSGSGKTTLIQSVEKLQIAYHKTQTVQVYSQFIDTPGEYLEHRSYYNALIVSSYDADIIGLVHDCDSDDIWLPPAFASVFSKDTIGIVTKVDLAKDEHQIQAARDHLTRAGANRTFAVSAINNLGTQDIAQYLLKT